MANSSAASASRYATIVVTVLSAMPCESCVKLVAIENTDTAVLKSQTSHHTTIGLRSHVSRSSTRANSSTYTGAQARFTSGTRQPARSAHTGRGSSRLWYANAAARRAISQFVSTTALATIMKSAITLTSTPSQVAEKATTLFNSTERFTISSAYRTTCTRAATPSTTIVAMRVARTTAADGPLRGAAVSSSGASKWSTRPHRG